MSDASKQWWCVHGVTGTCPACDARREARQLGERLGREAGTVMGSALAEPLKRLRVDYGELAAIVRDLARTDARYRTDEGIVCTLCGAEFPTGSGTPSYVDNHPDHCPLRRACDWVAAHPGQQGSEA